MSGSAFKGGDEDEDPQAKANRLAARAARFSNKLAGNRYKELDAARQQHLKKLEEDAVVGAASGSGQMEDATLMRGTCEEKCAEYEREFREFTGEINPFERRADGRMDHAKAVAAYTRSDAGAGVGSAAKLPSDLRTPRALVVDISNIIRQHQRQLSMNYLINTIMTSQPPGSTSPTPLPQRKCLGASVGFIRDRTRAIRKEFAMQSSWGALEAIEANEKIARWHILCLRELQENTGNQMDMHVDAAELGRCFTTLRQLYTDQRELGSTCANEAEFRAYMLIFDLTQKSTAILTGELSDDIASDPLVKAAWDIRVAAQRNFDTQKEGSKQNSELGRNMLSRFAGLLSRPDLPFLLSALVEIRLREMRRSELRALRGVYPPFKGDTVVYDETGGIKERRAIEMDLLDKLLGCEEQEVEGPAYDDVEGVDSDPDTEARTVVETFGVEMHQEGGRTAGAIVNKASAFNDNVDAPFTRRWKAITDKRQNISFVDIVNGQSGVRFGNVPARVAPSISFAPSSYRAPPPVQPAKPAAAAPSFFGDAFKASPAITSSQSAPTPPASIPFSFAPKAAASAKAPETPPPAITPKSMFSFEKPAASQPTPFVPAPLFTFAPHNDDGPKAPSAPKAPSFSIGAAASPAATPASSAPSAPSLKMFSFGPASTTPTPAPIAPPVTAPSAHPPSLVPVTKETAAPAPSPVPIAHAISPPQTVSREEKKRRRDALPALFDDLLSGVVNTLLREQSRVFANIIEDELFVRKQSTKLDGRMRNIVNSSQRFLDELVDKETRRLVKEARLFALKRRIIARQIGEYWRSWAKQQAEFKKRRKQEEEETYHRLREMTASTRRYDAMDVDVAEDLDFMDMPSADAETEDGDLGVDMVMRESSRLNEQFHAPSTFLSIVAQQVGHAFNDIVDPYSPISDAASDMGQVERHWTTIISPASDAGTAPNPHASAWLRRKFSPPSDEPFERHGFGFETRVVGRYDDVPVCTETGLVVFELPMRAERIAQIDANIADAKDRLKALIDATSTARNKYTTSLLFVSWEDTTLHAVVKDLDIQAEVDAFENATVVCLTSDELDGRVEPGVEKLISEAAPKQRVYLDIEMMFGRHFTQSWSRLIFVLSQICKRYDIHSQSAAGMVSAGLGVLDGLSRIFKLVTKGVTWDPSTTYEQIHLSKAGSGVLILLENASQSLTSDELLLQIAQIRHIPDIPSEQLVTSSLAALGAAFARRLKGTWIALDQFYVARKRVEVLNAYRDDILRMWDQSIERAIASVVPVPAVVDSPPTKVLGLSNGSNGSIGIGLGGKRTREEEMRGSRESKAAKSARLFRLISTVNVDLERGIEVD